MATPLGTPRFGTSLISPPVGGAEADGSPGTDGGGWRARAPAAAVNHGARTEKIGWSWLTSVPLAHVLRTFCARHRSLVPTFVCEDEPRKWSYLDGWFTEPTVCLGNNYVNGDIW